MVRIHVTDRTDMTLDVYRDVKQKYNNNNKSSFRFVFEGGMLKLVVFVLVIAFLLTFKPDKSNDKNLEINYYQYM